MTVVPDGARRILRALTTLAMNAVPAFVPSFPRNCSPGNGRCMK